MGLKLSHERAMSQSKYSRKKQFIMNDDIQLVINVSENLLIEIHYFCSINIW